MSKRICKTIYKGLCHQKLSSLLILHQLLIIIHIYIPTFTSDVHFRYVDRTPIAANNEVEEQPVGSFDEPKDENLVKNRTWSQTLQLFPFYILAILAATGAFQWATSTEIYSASAHEAPEKS